MLDQACERHNGEPYRIEYLAPSREVCAPTTGRRPLAQSPGEKTNPRFNLEAFSVIEPLLNGSWLIKGFLPANGLAVLYGVPGSGKSFVALDMALHVASRRAWAGQAVQQTGVVYIAAEGAGGFRKRVAAARDHYKLPRTTPFALISTSPNLGSQGDDATDLIQCIREQSAPLGFRPGLVVIDTLARSMDGADESSARDMGLFVANAERIERELGVLVLAVHHSGKDTDRGMRGSSALHGATSTEWEVHTTEAGHALRVVKVKDGEGGQAIPFRLFQVEVGRDEDGDAVTSLVVEVSSDVKHDETSNAGRRKPVQGQRAEFIKALTMAVDEMGAVPPTCPHIPRGQQCVTRQQLELYAEKRGFLTGMDERSRRSTLDRHVRTLAGDGHLGQWERWLWLP